jgi:CDP-6-deoxy-D-xylo-4-hexulose-3-dehydrase
MTGMRYELASSTWDNLELEAIQKVLVSGRTTMGPEVRHFEEMFAEYFGSNFAVMVNSGSSANLLGVAALTFHSSRKLPRGSEVIVPAVSWSTTYYPFHQYGLKLCFVDVDPETLCLNTEEVRRAINPNTSAIMAVNLLGQCAPLPELVEIASEHSIVLLEDNCESMGATIEGKYAGTWGVFGTFSTFFSHHISTMEGGMLITDDEEVRDIVVSLRAHGWTRELPENNFLHNKSGKPWDDHYRFVLPGYNLRPLEISAAIGIEQLKKLPMILEQRRHNLNKFHHQFSSLPNLRLQTGPGDSSSFGFSLILEGPLASKRDSLIEWLEKKNIQSRPIVAGNFTKQPVMEHMDAVISGDLRVSDAVHTNGLFLGNHHYDLSNEIEYARDVILEWMGKHQ